MTKVGESFALKFAEAWRTKLEAIPRGRAGQAELQSEKKALTALLEAPVPARKPKSGSLDVALADLREKMAEEAPERQDLLARLVNNMCTQADSFAADFAINQIGEERQAQELFEHAQNIDFKKAYLFKEIIKLEKIQIAESIMQIEAIHDQVNKFKVTFDSTIINLQMDLDIEELSSLNKLREYSLFGIHKTVPNSPTPYFSYYKELDGLCRDPDFRFEFSMPYNTDPNRFQKELLSRKPSKSGARGSTDMMMCHHCKVLLPSSKFFVCSKKCKCLQSEPCRVCLRRGLPPQEHHGFQDSPAAHMRQDLLQQLCRRLVQLRARRQSQLPELPKDLFLHALQSVRQPREVLPDLRAAWR